MKIPEEVKRPEVAAGIGAATALVAALVVPAAAILSVAAITAIGFYGYKLYEGRKAKEQDGTGQEKTITQEEVGNGKEAK
jgi:hypothetical protein